ncbi:cytochrome c1 [Niveispirillum lacus]|uniref:Cytochrome c1 n=1 Tax=Niveispirillum lacus TaxID=1981099 RepID=A0A255Z4I7_9PROT|nr:cytochrome c1 [Niveispirillum lacus]OYQ36433.1 cytochrome c1 [Niveispirillum lacus]
MRRLRTLLAAGAMTIAGLTSTALAAGNAPVPPAQTWAHGGVNSFLSFFKGYDYASVQRGFQVYKEVCSSCHAMHLLSYRNLLDVGFTEAEVKAIAAAQEITAGPNDQGEMFTRPGLPADRFKSPFPNAQAAAAANGGKAPPDLSLIVKARAHHEDYIYALLTGYTDAPEGFELSPGSNYNKYFPGNAIAMAQPIYENGVTYTDGTPATIEQQAKDVTNFMAWAAEPKLEERRRVGIMVILFLVFFAGIMYAAKRRLWSEVH